MRKIMFSLLVLSPLLSQAQLDTLFTGDRVPTYYYWDNWWIDNIYANTDSEYYYRTVDGIGGFAEERCAPEAARCFYTKDSLKIIGVAAAIEVGKMPTNTTLPLKDSTVLPEYFRVFYYHGPTDSLSPIIAETRYDTASHRYLHCVGGVPAGENHPPTFRPVLEAYFESPVYVCDTFYVSATANNNYYGVDSVKMEFGGEVFYNYYGSHAHPLTRGSSSTYWQRSPYYYNFQPFGHSLVRYHVVTTYGNVPSNPGFERVHEWFEPQSSNWYNEPAPPVSVKHIFPIFDTSTYTDTTTSTWCLAPDNLHVLTPDAESTVLLWHSASGSEWEVSHCIGCTVPDSGTITHHTATLANLTNLEEGATYTVWVRTLCDNGDTSLWSNSLQFYVPMPADTGVTQQVLSIDDAYFHLSPNPASKMVNAFSSFQMRGIEIYSLSGTLMKHEDVCALSVNIDISNLPKGLYIVRASTVHGMAYARLIIQ